MLLLELFVCCYANALHLVYPGGEKMEAGVRNMSVYEEKRHTNESNDASRYASWLTSQEHLDVYNYALQS